MEAVKSKAKIALGKQEVEGDIKFSFTRNLLASVFISTPFKGFRKVSVVVSHEGNILNNTGLCVPYLTLTFD
jgi:creatinine amidohydrolase/Fe(II)-dependent formamide hydrolase-like protein